MALAGAQNVSLSQCNLTSIGSISYNNLPPKQITAPDAVLSCREYGMKPRYFGSHAHGTDVLEPHRDVNLEQRDEYMTGQVPCEDCGMDVSFQDESEKGGSRFTLKHRNTHREGGCATRTPTFSTSTSHPRDYSASAAAPTFTCPQYPPKRRRAKRTEEERIDYLRADPYVAHFEAYRVLCGSCDKWIRLRPNSTYCSIPWDAHRKSCLAQKTHLQNLCGVGERKQSFSRNSDVGQRSGTTTASMSPTQSTSTSPSVTALSSFSMSASPVVSKSRSASAPPSTGLYAQAHASLGHGYIGEEHLASTSALGDDSSLNGPNPITYAPAHESRRRNVQQRAATLRADHLIGEVEPNRVFCALCQHWVPLRQDSSYCAYPWLQHREKCLARHQRRTRKATAIVDARAKNTSGCLCANTASCFHSVSQTTQYRSQRFQQPISQCYVPNNDDWGQYPLECNLDAHWSETSSDIEDTEDSEELSGREPLGSEDEDMTDERRHLVDGHGYGSDRGQRSALYPRQHVYEKERPSRHPYDQSQHPQHGDTKKRMRPRLTYRSSRHHSSRPHSHSQNQSQSHDRATRSWDVSNTRGHENDGHRQGYPDDVGLPRAPSLYNTSSSHVPEFGSLIGGHILIPLSMLRTVPHSHPF